jgi:hypothetical protein
MTDRDLFVERVGRAVGFSKNQWGNPVGRRDLCGAESQHLIEQYLHPRGHHNKEGEVFVMGDCASVSIDKQCALMVQTLT